jgi:hypothetical protein
MASGADGNAGVEHLALAEFYEVFDAILPRLQEDAIFCPGTVLN